MADKSTQLILDALGRASADPAGMPLHTTKTTPGLFNGTGSARQAAQRCLDTGYLRVVRTETRGKAVHEICTITEKGLAYLLDQVSPRQVLEDLVRTLEARQAQAGELVVAARRTEATLEALKVVAEKVLQHAGRPAPPASSGSPSTNGSETWKGALISYLTQWQTARAAEDCPLPELYQHALKTAAALTIGQFHDGLRQLHDQGRIYLHPWTGPLYDLPDPPYALLVGHEIAYYASLRVRGQESGVRDQGSGVRDQEESFRVPEFMSRVEPPDS
jgi:hypothetical protein